MELIDYDNLSPEAHHQMKIAEQRKVARDLEHEEAMEEGKKEKALEIAKAMLNQGISIDIIINTTGLNREDIIR